MRCRARSSIQSGAMLIAPGRCPIANDNGDSASTRTKSAPPSIRSRSSSREIVANSTVTKTVCRRECRLRKCEGRRTWSSIDNSPLRGSLATLLQSVVARQRHLVVAHLFDVVHERPDRLEEGAEFRALAEARKMSVLRVPLDPNNAL